MGFFTVCCVVVYRKPARLWRVASMWSRAEESALSAGVAALGCSWTVIARLPGLSARSPTACRIHWTRHFVRLHQECSAVPGAVLQLSAASAPGRHCALPDLGALPRGRLVSRPWDYHVRATRVRRRAPTSRQRQLLELWGLLQPCGRLLLCNLSRAEHVARRHLRSVGVPRAHLNYYLLRVPLAIDTLIKLHMVYIPGQPCHTLTSSNAHRYWVSGPDFAGFVVSDEVAAFMGVPRHRHFRAIQRSLVSSYTVCYCLAESVPVTMASLCALYVSRALPSNKRYTVGSLYSGAFDAFTCALSSVMSISRSFVAERCPRKRSALISAFGPPLVFADVAYAVAHAPPVDILVATPSCHEVSPGRQYGSAAERAATGAVAVDTQLILLGRAITRCTPAVVLLEQSCGLASHHVGAYSRFRAGLDTFPYLWHHGVLDGVSAGGSHSRSRLIWIGIHHSLCEPCA